VSPNSLFLRKHFRERMPRSNLWMSQIGLKPSYMASSVLTTVAANSAATLATPIRTGTRPRRKGAHSSLIARKRQPCARPRAPTAVNEPPSAPTSRMTSPRLDGLAHHQKLP
jgi:hypothetical protein